MLIHIQNLVDDAKCYDVVRRMRWPEGVRCPHCGSAQVSKRGFIHIKKNVSGMNVEPADASSMI